MNRIDIKCTVMPGAKLPAYQTEGSAGADLCAFVPEPVVIKKGGRALIPTGLAFEIPVGYEVQVRPRSGLALKHGITCLNTPGTIDSDYRGQVHALLINLGDEDFVVNNGDRIAQAVVAPVTQGNFLVADKLSETQRGAGGFGSTGV